MFVVSTIMVVSVLMILIISIISTCSSLLNKNEFVKRFEKSLWSFDHVSEVTIGIHAAEAVVTWSDKTVTGISTRVGMNPTVKSVGFGSPFFILSPVRRFTATHWVPASKASIPAFIIFIFPVAVAFIDTGVHAAIHAGIPVDIFKGVNGVLAFPFAFKIHVIVVVIPVVSMVVIITVAVAVAVAV